MISFERTRHIAFAFFSNGALLLFSLVVCCAAAEIVLRLGFLEGEKRWYDRPKYYYLPEASQTLRGNIPTRPKDENSYRIAVIGDSFTFAPFMQYDDSFPARLERMLNLNTSGKKAEVLNYGVPGYSTTHEVGTVKHALRKKPDLVILEVTLNDPELKPYTPLGVNVVKNEHGAYVVQAWGTNQSWLEQHSRLYRLLTSRFKNYSGGKSYEQYFRDLYADRLAMRRYRAAMKEIVRMTAKKNVQIVAVVFPLFGRDINESYPFADLHREVGQVLQGVGIPYLDLKEIYAGIPAERLQVMPGEDYHPNEIGHRMAAEAIYSWLTQSKFLPPELVIRNVFSQRTQLMLKDELRLKSDASVLPNRSQ